MSAALAHAEWGCLYPRPSKPDLNPETKQLHVKIYTKQLHVKDNNECDVECVLSIDELGDHVDVHRTQHTLLYPALHLFALPEYFRALRLLEFVYVRVLR